MTTSLAAGEVGGEQVAKLLEGIDGTGLEARVPMLCCPFKD